MVDVSRSMLDFSDHYEYYSPMIGGAYWACKHCQYWSYGASAIRAHLTKRHANKLPQVVPVRDSIEIVSQWGVDDLPWIFEQIIEARAYFDTIKFGEFDYVFAPEIISGSTAIGELSFQKTHYMYGNIVYIVWKPDHTGEYRFSGWHVKLNDNTCYI